MNGTDLSHAEPGTAPAQGREAFFRTVRPLYGAHVHANGIRQHYLRYGGQGQPLILIPGITSPAMTWGFVGARFGDAFDVYVLDVRGRGLSETRPGLDYGLDALADDVVAFAAALGLDDAGTGRPVVVGHSMGARIAIRAARRAPGAFASLVLADPPVSGPGRRPYPAPLSWYVDSIRLAVRGMDWQDLRPFSPTWGEADLRLRAEWLATCDEDAIRRAYADFQETDIHGDLPHLNLPAQLVVAGAGGVILDEDIAEIGRLNPAIVITSVSAAGHMIPWDDFDGFFAAIDPFLATGSAPAVVAPSL